MDLLQKSIQTKQDFLRYEIHVTGPEILSRIDHGTKRGGFWLSFQPHLSF